MRNLPMGAQGYNCDVTITGLFTVYKINSQFLPSHDTIKPMKRVDHAGKNYREQVRAVVTRVPFTPGR